VIGTNKRRQPCPSLLLESLIFSPTMWEASIERITKEVLQHLERDIKR